MSPKMSIRKHWAHKWIYFSANSVHPLFENKGLTLLLRLSLIEFLYNLGWYRIGGKNGQSWTSFSKIHFSMCANFSMHFFNLHLGNGNTLTNLIFLNH